MERSGSLSSTSNVPQHFCGSLRLHAPDPLRRSLWPCPIQGPRVQLAQEIPANGIGPQLKRKAKENITPPPSCFIGGTKKKRYSYSFLCLPSSTFFYVLVFLLCRKKHTHAKNVPYPKFLLFSRCYLQSDIMLWMARWNISLPPSCDFRFWNILYETMVKDGT